LINPFRLSESGVRITANRRRWIHVFPLDSRGCAKQGHHYVAGACARIYPCGAHARTGHSTIYLEESEVTARSTTAATRMTVSTSKDDASTSYVGSLKSPGKTLIVADAIAAKTTPREWTRAHVA
jgi:hypothetical protein